MELSVYTYISFSLEAIEADLAVYHNVTLPIKHRHYRMDSE